MKTSALSVPLLAVLSALFCASCGKDAAGDSPAARHARLVARADALEKEAREAVARAIAARDEADAFAKSMSAGPPSPAPAASGTAPAAAGKTQGGGGLLSSLFGLAADDPVDEGRLPADEAETAALERLRAVAKTVARSPYRGAISIDAETGRVLFQDGADTPCLPASMVKMMDLLLVLEAVERGELREDDRVAVSPRAAKTGGSQVFLDPRETFTLENMLYALMVQSANDAAVAVAEHAAGSCEAMVERMNARAAELGMEATRFHSVHGLPADVPGGQLNDVSTPRDMAVLARELCRHPGAFKYTSCDFHVFRPGPKPPKFELRTHNPVLQAGTRIEGADGLKTGYTRTAGYSLAASVVRGGRRVIVVTMGTGVTDKKGDFDANAAKSVRNKTVARLVDEAFAK